MIDTVIAAIDRTGGPVVLIGSSLGALTAARVAERDDRVRACVLLAPAFQLVERWKQQLGADWDVWRAKGTRDVADYTTGGMSTVDFGFVEDVERIDVGYPDVRVPVLIMHGVNDDVVPVERARTFAANRPNVRLIELADGHELIASLPTLLAESERFLAALAL
jgi:pimeloyl-ACP methyl ester carboxylesterase